MSLSVQLQSHIESFLANQDLVSLYKQYKFGRDTWENGFTDMRQLEVDLTTHAKQGYVTKPDIMKVAEWGRLPNKKGVRCPELVRISIYGVDDPVTFLRTPPSAALIPLREAIIGMGPTYFTKILMFSRPQLYGAIDTRLVRVFGEGDPNAEELKWLSLMVKKGRNRWHIPESQPSWPSQYDTWVEILHHIARLCNSSGLKCPHPDEYIRIGLREKETWVAADVETALFSYASMRLEKAA